VPDDAPQQPQPPAAPNGRPGLTPPSRRGGSSGFVTEHIVKLGFAPQQAVENAIGEARKSARTPEQVLLADGVINTAKKRGVPPRQIMRDFIRGKIPLMSTAGGAITLDQLSDEQKKSLGVPSAAEAPPPRGGWAAGLKEGEAY